MSDNDDSYNERVRTPSPRRSRSPPRAPTRERRRRSPIASTDIPRARIAQRSRSRDEKDEKDEKKEEKNEEKKEEKKEEKDEKKKPKNIGEVLSILDGIGNYDGSIIIATTNEKNKLPDALCRDMRLTPIYFTYITNDNLCKMVCKYYKILETKWPYKTEPSKLSCSKARNLTEIHRESFKNFINDIKPFYSKK